MSWSDALGDAGCRELLSDVYEYHPKTAFAYVTIKARIGLRGSLPCNERQLATIARCSLAWWRNHAWPELQGFFTIRGDRLYPADGKLGDVDDAGHPAKPRFANPRSVRASVAANARWQKTRAADEAAQALRGEASGRAESGEPHINAHENRMQSAYAQPCANDGISMACAYENACENDAESMRGASDPHDSAYANARAPSLSLTDSVLSNSLTKPASKEEATRGRESARADPHDAQACGNDAPGHAPGDAPGPDWKLKKLLRKAARAETNIPLPDDWQPAPASIALAHQLGHNVDVLAADFRDHYRASGERKPNWDGAFMKWVRREVVFDPDKLKQRHLTMPITGGAAGQPKVAAAPTPEDEAIKARVAAAEAWASPALAAQWARVRDQVRVRIGPVAWRTWLAGLALGAMEGDEVVLHLPSAFERDHVAKEYAGHLTQLWRAENPAVRRVELRVAPSQASGGQASGAAPDRAASG